MTAPTVVAALLLVLHLPAPAGLTAQAAPPGEAEAVIRVVTDVFDAMRGRDTVALRAAFHPEARLVTVVPGGAGGDAVRVGSVDAFVEAVGSGDAHLDETIHDPVVRIDGDLAGLWTYYELRVDGELSHCGVDALHLVRGGEGWKIVNLADTRRREGCREEG